MTKGEKTNGWPITVIGIYSSTQVLYPPGNQLRPSSLDQEETCPPNIPLSDSKAFDQWLYKRWAEKDELLEHFQQHNCFPADEGYVEAQIKLNNSLEILQIMASALAVVLVWWLVKTITQSFTAFPLLGM